MRDDDKGGADRTDRPATTFVAGFHQTDTLVALRELLDLANSVRPTVARRADVTETELVALEHLIRTPLGPGEVARLLGVTSAAATGIVDRLEGRGHVERRAHPTDRRRTELVITDSAREDVLSHLLPMFRGLAALDAELTEEERVVGDRYLRRAIAAVRSVL